MCSVSPNPLLFVATAIGGVRTFVRIHRGHLIRKVLDRRDPGGDGCGNPLKHTGYAQYRPLRTVAFALAQRKGSHCAYAHAHTHDAPFVWRERERPIHMARRGLTLQSFPFRDRLAERSTRA
jgi:hypothetical protein